jgi:hypothetical protein
VVDFSANRNIASPFLGDLLLLRSRADSQLSVAFFSYQDRHVQKNASLTLQVWVYSR